METEDTLLTRYLEGNPTAGEELVRALSPRLLSYLYRLTGSREEAHDLGQEAFARFFNALPRYEARGRTLSYLLTIGTNLVRNRARGTRELPGSNILHLQPSPRRGPDDDAIHSELGRQMRREILALPLGDREALVLKEFHSMSCEQIARMLDTSEGAIRQRLFRARKTLIRRLRPRTGTGYDREVTP